MNQRRRVGLLEVLGALCIAAALSLSYSCNSEQQGIYLPEGEALLGEMVFIEMHCNQCHTIADIEWAGDEAKGDVNVRLGGAVSSGVTYGDLITAVIHPSHEIARGYQEEGVNRFGRSKMKNYNDAMSVQQLVDLVTYLQEQYNVRTPQHKYYPAW